MEVEYLMKLSQTRRASGGNNKTNNNFCTLIKTLPEKGKLSGWIFLISCFFSSRLFLFSPLNVGWKTPAVLEKDGKNVSIGFSSLSFNIFSRIKDCWILKTRASSAPWKSFFHSMWFLSGSILSAFFSSVIKAGWERKRKENCRDVSCSVFEMGKGKSFEPRQAGREKSSNTSVKL